MALNNLPFELKIVVFALNLKRVICLLVGISGEKIFSVLGICIIFKEGGVQNYVPRLVLLYLTCELIIC